MAEKFSFHVAVEKNPVSDDTPETPKKTLASKTSSEDSIWTRMIHTPKSEKISFKNYATKVEVLEDTPQKKSKWDPSTPERNWYRSLLTGGNGHDRSAIDQDIDEKVEIQKSDAGSNVEEKLSIRKSSGKVGFVEDPKEPKTEVPSEEKKWSSFSWLFGSKTDREVEDGSAKKLTRQGATRRKPIIVDVGDGDDKSQHSEKKITVEVREHTVIPSPAGGKSKKSKLQGAKIKIDQDEKKKDVIEESYDEKLRRWFCCCCTTPAKSNKVKSENKETEEAKEAIETQTKPKSQTKSSSQYKLQDADNKIDQNEAKKDEIEEASEEEGESQRSQSKLRKWLCCCYTPTKSTKVKSKTEETKTPKETLEPQGKPKWELKEEFRQVTTDKIYVKVTA